MKRNNRYKFRVGETVISKNTGHTGKVVARWRPAPEYKGYVVEWNDIKVRTPIHGDYDVSVLPVAEYLLKKKGT